MVNATTIGLDIVKSVFQVKGVDAAGAVIIWRKLIGGGLGLFESLPRCASISTLATGSGRCVAGDRQNNPLTRRRA